MFKPPKDKFTSILIPINQNKTGSLILQLLIFLLILFPTGLLSSILSTKIYQTLGSIGPTIELITLIGLIFLANAISTFFIVRLVRTSLSRHLLEEERTKDEIILASLGRGLVVFDRSGRITKVNQAFEKLTGFSERETVGKHLADIILIKDENDNLVSFHDKIFARILRNERVGSKTTTPYYYTRKDKTRFPVKFMISPIKVGSTITGAVQTFRDATKDQEIDRAKSEFVSLASHQLRTPLTTINWYIEMLTSKKTGPVNKIQSTYIQEITRASKRMVELVNSLLNVSRIEMGTFSIEPLPVDVVQLAEATIKELFPQITTKHLKLTKIYDPKDIIIKNDPKLVSIIIQNLLSNAVKYTPKDGKIGLSIKGVNAHILIKVTDTGLGIPAPQQDKIFGKFFRADNVQIMDVDGTGLGLYLTKTIVNICKGRIWFESTEGKGTTFFVNLPLKSSHLKKSARTIK